MKRFCPRCFSGAFVVLGTFLINIAQAAPVDAFPGPGQEPALAGPGGILDRRFGIENLTLVDETLDQFWENQGTIDVKVISHWAGFSHAFGFIDADNLFTPLLTARGRGHGPRVSFDSEDSGNLFRFGIDPSGAPLWSSSVSDNTDGLDHMMTWQITTSPNKHLLGAYIIAWEDLADGGDGDFNDLVVLVRNDVAPAVVPLPAALWLFASGLLGLATIVRRRARLNA